MSVHKLSGRKGWQARVYIGRDPLTKASRYRSRNARTEKAARAAELDLRADRKRKRDRAHTMNALWDDWLEHLDALVAARARSPTTVHDYRSKIDLHLRPLIGDRLASDIDTRLVDGLYRRLLTRGQSPANVAAIHRVLRASLSTAVRWGWIDTNPARLASPLRVDREEPQPPSHAEVIELIERARVKEPVVFMAVELAAVTGARRGEVCALRWTDVDGATVRIARGIVAVTGRGLVEQKTKTRRTRTLQVDEGTANHLVEHHDWCEKTAAALGGVLRDDAFVLADLAADRTGGRPWRPDRLSKAFRRLADDVEVDVWLHLIRHWNASMQLDAGRSLPDVAARLGHSSPQVTARVYAHVLDSPDAGAVAAVTKALGRGS